MTGTTTHSPNSAPPFQHHSRTDWSVMLWGGTDPRTGFPQRPLEFCFFEKFYTPHQIRAKAAELAKWHKREHFVIQPPVGQRERQP